MSKPSSPIFDDPELGHERRVRFLENLALATAMTDLLRRITANPEQCVGRPCIRGTRIRVIDVPDLLAAELSREQVLEELPDLV